MPVRPFGGRRPALAPDVFVAPGAVVLGAVRLGEGSSVWYNAVVRADADTIEIGRWTNVQDGCIVHVDPGAPVRIGDHVTVGHGAVVHACTIGHRCLIGMKAVVLTGAQIGDDCIVGAGALVPEGKLIPPRSLVLGVPARVVREVRDDELAGLLEQAQHYAEHARRHREETAAWREGQPSGASAS